MTEVSDGYAARSWVRWYAPGVPEEVYVPDIALPQLLDDAARDFPRRRAVTFLGRTMNYRALVGAVDRFAAALSSSARSCRTTPSARYCAACCAPNTSGRGDT